MNFLFIEAERSKREQAKQGISLLEKKKKKKREEE
jgi:hypothetical protein